MREVIEKIVEREEGAFTYCCNADYSYRETSTNSDPETICEKCGKDADIRFVNDGYRCPFCNSFLTILAYTADDDDGGGRSYELSKCCECKRWFRSEGREWGR